MAVEVASRRSRKRKPATESLAIGEMDQTIFACPACARPLVNGARRCPGCGTRLIMGVPAQKASVLIGAGLLLGLIFGAGFVMAASTLERTIKTAAAPSTANPVASMSPGPTAGTASASPGTGPISAVPALTRSALVQTAAVDDRLAASSATLAKALASSKFDTYGVSQILRAMSADAVVGLQMSAHIGAWPGGEALSGELSAFYTTVRSTAAEGLSASIRNTKVYRATGHKMVQLLGGLGALDAHVQEVATQAGVTLEPVEAAVP
jgi:hypothetical protein